MKIVVISASASLQEKIQKWVTYWKSCGYTVAAHPEPIREENFSTEYPIVHQKFYEKLAKADVHFIANEEKGGVVGYIGPGVFAEVAFRVGINLVQHKDIPIVLLAPISPKSLFYEDLQRWISLGWIQSFETFKMHKMLPG
jgi:hypothetical protein